MSSDDLRALRAAESSKRVVGAVWNDDVPTPGLFGPDPVDWVPFEVYRQSLISYNYDDPEAGWESVPSDRTLKRRRQAAQRRRRRDAGLRQDPDIGLDADSGWLGGN